jgi:hypothetical protein
MLPPGIARRARVAALVTLGTLLASPAAVVLGQQPAEPPPERPAVAVLELFTSGIESTQPTADEIADQVGQSERPDNGRVFVVAFHVDAHDVPGWKDPFAQPRHADRLRDYLRYHDRSDGTLPAVVLNGQLPLHGTDRFRVEEQVAAALRRPPVVDVRLSASRGPQGQPIWVRYSLSRPVRNAVLNIALLESRLAAEPPRETDSSGRMIQYNNVVRSFKTVALRHDDYGRVRLVVPPHWEPQHGAIVAWVQDRKTLAVLGAARLEPEDLHQSP